MSLRIQISLNSLSATALSLRSVTHTPLHTLDAVMLEVAHGDIHRNRHLVELLSVVFEQKIRTFEVTGPYRDLVEIYVEDRIPNSSSGIFLAGVAG